MKQSAGYASNGCWQGSCCPPEHESVLTVKPSAVQLVLMARNTGIIMNGAKFRLIMAISTSMKLPKQHPVADTTLHTLASMAGAVERAAMTPPASPMQNC